MGDPVPPPPNPYESPSERRKAWKESARRTRRAKELPSGGVRSQYGKEEAVEVSIKPQVRPDRIIQKSIYPKVESIDRFPMDRKQGKAMVSSGNVKKGEDGKPPLPRAAAEAHQQQKPRRPAKDQGQEGRDIQSQSQDGRIQRSSIR
jgi:hypothetical protein